MGYYTGLRFEGVVRERYRKGFKDFFDKENPWKAFADEHFDQPVFQRWAVFSRSSFIPRGYVELVDWDDDDPAWEHTFDEETGHWQFQCSLKNYKSTIEFFRDTIAPAICIECIHFEWKGESEGDSVHQSAYVQRRIDELSKV